MQNLKLQVAPWSIGTRSIATHIAMATLSTGTEPAPLDCGDVAQIVVTAAAFHLTSWLRLRLAPVRSGDDQWKDAPSHGRTSDLVLDWGEARYGDVNGLSSLRRHRRFFRKARHERRVWHATAWVPGDPKGGRSFAFRDVELRFDADGIPRLFDVQYSTPERDLPRRGGTA